MRQLLVVSTRGLGHLLQMLEAKKYTNEAICILMLIFTIKKPPR